MHFYIYVMMFLSLIKPIGTDGIVVYDYGTAKVQESKNLNQVLISQDIVGNIKDEQPIDFSDEAPKVEGITTFRTNRYRNNAVYGQSNIKEKAIQKIWSFNTSGGTGTPNPKYGPWGGGSGWTGQPCIIKWESQVLKAMNVKEEFKQKKDFVEVVQGSLDGKVYFLDLETGKQTREPIATKNPIKGGISLDPRGWPILYVGQGIPETNTFGYHIYSLIDGKELYYINGDDKWNYRDWWFAFDSSPLVDPQTDTVLQAGENGNIYKIKLNTHWNPEAGTLSMKPEMKKMRYKIKGNEFPGIENSLVGYKNYVYFADNGGSIQCMDANTMKIKWVWYGKTADDTNATMTLKEEYEEYQVAFKMPHSLSDKPIKVTVKRVTPYLYMGAEIDKQQGKTDLCYFRKIDALTGKVVWENGYKALYTVSGGPGWNGGHVNGGIYSANVLGEKNLDGMVFVAVARINQLYAGELIALDTKTGKELWKWNMHNYAWSSPTIVYDQKGDGYIMQGDSAGRMWVVDGKTGKPLTNIKLGNNLEASPAIYGDYMVVGSRGTEIHGVKIK